MFKNRHELDEVMTAIQDRQDMLLDKIDEDVYREKSKIFNNQLKSLKSAFNLIKKVHKNKIKVWYKETDKLEKHGWELRRSA